MSNDSLCINCKEARNPASLILKKKGYIGCAYYAKQNKPEDVNFVAEAEELAEGWVDLKSHISTEFKDKSASGVITNMMLLTKNVTSCKQYELYTP